MHYGISSDPNPVRINTIDIDHLSYMKYGINQKEVMLNKYTYHNWSTNKMFLVNLELVEQNQGLKFMIEDFGEELHKLKEEKAALADKVEGTLKGHEVSIAEYIVCIVLKWMDMDQHFALMLWHVIVACSYVQFQLISV